MVTGQKLDGYKLPTNPEQRGGARTEGFTTPTQNRNPQIQSIPPKKVLPIIFIPGIMGSNLRLNAERQAELKQKHNIAWRPDDLVVTYPMHDDTAAERQMRFDPKKTELDTYDPIANNTGNAKGTSDLRNRSVHFSGQYGGSWRKIDAPLLQNDRAGQGGKTRDRKARERGWGEVFFGSYEKILSECELRLNGAFSERHKDPYLMESIIDVEPSKWGAHSTPPMASIDEATLRAAVKGCWFPVHAMGYNWLKSNEESGVSTANRVKELIARYREQGYKCEKVILITHSMGGLVARAMIHPKMGNVGELVLGVIHGVMPAIGAGAAYKRMRCGFEGDDKAAEILGAKGSHVTPVLGNSQGGLELLPTQAYGNNWLQLVNAEKTLKSFPQNGDPYEEIYKRSDQWYGLLREDWLNPAGLQGIGLIYSYKLLDRAKRFHNEISSTYHEQSYAHYGADLERMAWHKVVWKIDEDVSMDEITKFQILSDDEKGKLRLISSRKNSKNPDKDLNLNVRLLSPVDPGDQTVPTYSADAQLKSGKFKGIFRQKGYEHQASYGNEQVIAATIYSLYKIISTMKWAG